MEHNLRYYQLAHKVQEDLKSPRDKHPLRPLPTHIKEEEDSQATFQDNRICNIFEEEPTSRPSEIHLDNLPSYQYVGVREMKNYIAKTDKKRKNNNTMFRRSYSNLSSISISRISQIRSPPQRYLSKEQLLERYNNPSRTHESSCLEETLLNQDTICRKSLPINTTLNQSLGTSLQAKEKIISNDFSLKKVMSKLKKYQRGWAQQIWQKQHNRPFKQRSKQTKNTSLLDRIKNFREKIQQKEEQEVIQNLENIKPKLWTRALRTSKTMVTLCEKNLEKIAKDRLVTSGHGKFEKEVSWLQQKDRKGMVFRPLKINHSIK